MLLQVWELSWTFRMAARSTAVVVDITTRRMEAAESALWATVTGRMLRSPIGALLLVCTFTVLYGAAETISPPGFGFNTAWTGGAECAGPEFELKSVCICPRETICVRRYASLVFLACSRLGAYFGYPLCVVLFLSKAHNLRGILQRTYLSE